jgi:N-dimethylarginine dimethylaminohydrolase
MAKTVLVCAPEYFQIEYEINPWMHTDNPVEPQKARTEFDVLVALYKKLGVTVKHIKPAKGLPDMVFAANFGFVIDDLFIRSNFRYKERRREAELAEQYFKCQNFRVEKLPNGIFFEGQGDMFYADGKFYCGHGERTSKDAIPHLEKILDESIISYEVNDPYYYHMDTCFAPLGHEAAIVKPSSFSAGDCGRMKKHFKTIVEVPDAGTPLFACNAVVVGKNIVVGEGLEPVIKKALKALDFTIHETPMHEFLKSGGAVKCLSLEYFTR